MIPIRAAALVALVLASTNACSRQDTVTALAVPGSEHLAGGARTVVWLQDGPERQVLVRKYAFKEDVSADAFAIRNNAALEHRLEGLANLAMKLECRPLVMTPDAAS